MQYLDMYIVECEVAACLMFKISQCCHCFFAVGLVAMHGNATEMSLTVFVLHICGTFQSVLIVGADVKARRWRPTF